MLEKAGLIEVKTYLNSGNVIFSCDGDDIRGFTKLIETMLEKQFDFNIPVFIIPKEELEEILQNAPDWWGNENKEIYDNLILMIPPVTFNEVFNKIGEPNEELENIKNYKDVIFWSFSRKDFQKTNWWAKTASTNISNKLTIRTANTVRKVIGM